MNKQTTLCPPLERQYYELYEAVKELNSETSTSELIELITSSFYARFLYLVDADQDRTIDHNKTFPLKETHLSELYSTLRLVVHLTRINERWEAIESLEKERKAR
ncbi:hypothetical protein GCM10028808_74940 [Spirosoma migulaei]